MNLGNKISNLRRKNNLSQEELGELVGVTRQTISKWELEETTPDIMQAKKLSKIFNISLDELTDNDINNVLIEKVSNTEKLAGITIKILKIFGILLIVFLVLLIAIFIIFNFNPSKREDRKVKGKYSITCNLDNREYLYDIEYNKDYVIINSGGDAFISNHIDIDKYEDANQVLAHIEDYFKVHNGNCKINE